MRNVLYKDKFVEVYCDKIVIKTYVFPIATSKHVSIHELRCIYYKKQQAWADILVTKGWGMTLYPVWWACDLRRHFPKNSQHFNVILDTGSVMKQGFSVVDIHKFLKALRPITNAPFENRFPKFFEHRILPQPICDGAADSEGLLEEENKKTE
uniref:Uncharacterized protein n=1 Tax=Panagrolaimus superbus TaxID=310955 RepID=A0A914Z1W5_9BILA